MVLQQPVNELLLQLKELLLALSNQEYTKAIPVLSEASIGAHTRHVIELFQALFSGYEVGNVNYEARKRDYLIESNQHIAIEKLDELNSLLEKPDKSLQLISEYGIDNQVIVATNYYRELIYNIEHAVHHMALIRVAIITETNIFLPNSFGVASSTLKFRESKCAQ
jgi:transcriptional regulator of heat shock response